MNKELIKILTPALRQYRKQVKDEFVGAYDCDVSDQIVSGLESELQSLRAENERLSSALKIAIETFQKYEMDVDEYPTIEHINMMNALHDALKDSNNE